MVLKGDDPNEGVEGGGRTNMISLGEVWSPNGLVRGSGDLDMILSPGQLAQ